MNRFDQVMDEYFQKIGLKEQIRQRKWLEKWPEVVGTHINRYTRPLVFKDGMLWVEVSDSSWLYHLTTLQEKIKNDFNKIIGFNFIKKIKLVNTGTFKQEKEIVKPYENSFVQENIIFAENKDFKNRLVLDKKERQEIEKLVEIIPLHFKNKLRDFFNNIYLQQKNRREQGAVLCRVCGLPCYKNEIREDLCFFCYRESEEWLKLLQLIFQKRPWLNFSDLKKSFFPLREELFKFCKEKIRKKYFDDIMMFLTDEGWQKEDRNTVLSKLLQHYILFVTGKEPFLIQPEDEFKAIKDFAGLIKYLEGGKIEYNNDYVQ